MYVNLRCVCTLADFGEGGVGEGAKVLIPATDVYRRDLRRLGRVEVIKIGEISGSTDLREWVRGSENWNTKVEREDRRSIKDNGRGEGRRGER